MLCSALALSNPSLDLTWNLWFVYSRSIHHLCDAEEPEGGQKGSVKAQRGQGCLTLLCFPPGHTKSGGAQDLPRPYGLL